MFRFKNNFKKYLVIIICLLLAFVFSCKSKDREKIKNKKNTQIQIYHSIYAQVEIISPAGIRVIIDLYQPYLLSKSLTNKDILLITHGHPDHSCFEALKFKGKKLYYEEGIIIKKDVKITGISSLHAFADNEEFLKKGGSNYIFLIEIGKIRMAHFGDIGQEELTEKQLKILGKIDIAITQFSNSYSGISFTNKKGFKLMNQIKPKIIIPTHHDSACADYASIIWDTYYTDNPFIVTDNILTGNTKMVYIGEQGKGWLDCIDKEKVKYIENF